MPSGAEVLGNGAIRGEKALRMTRRLKPLHAIFALPRGSMRVLTPVIEVATLPVFHSRQDFALGRPVALQLIRNDHARDTPLTLEQLAKELLGGVLVAATLHQNVEHVIVLIHRAPEIGYFCPTPENVKSAWAGVTSRTEKYCTRQENMSG